MAGLAGNGMYEFVVTLVQPFTVLYLLLGAATVNLWRKPRERPRRLLVLTIAFVGLTLLCTPAVAHLALGSLEWQYPPANEMPADAQAIVVLGAGVRVPGETRARAELDEDSLQRCLHAADLYRQSKACTVLVSGGKQNPEDPGPTCAQAMSDFLIQLGVRATDMVLEESSRTTYENALECTKLLEKRQIRKAVLVTDAVDMFRALRCFRKQGVELLPSPCHYRAVRSSVSLFTFIPNPGAARNCQRVCHEWMGMAWYMVHGRV
jgi:uncharacterized SAM-binding protein YcdF (DUF218 family)